MALMKNEWMKAWYGRKIWVFIVVIAACILLGTGLTVFLNSLDNGGLTGSLFLELGFPLLAPIINIYMVIQVSGAIAGEFRSGTAKQLLIRPVSRTKLLVTKWFSMAVLGILFYLLIAFVLFLINMILFGSNVSWTDGANTMMSLVAYSLPSMLFYIMLAVLVACLTRSTALTIVITLIPYFFGDIFTILLNFYEWPKWVIFTHLDLVNIYYMEETFIQQPFDYAWQSILFIGLHGVIFLVLAHIVFKKRDVL